MKNDKQRCGTRRYHQSEMKNPTTLISGTVTPKWTVPGERNLQLICLPLGLYKHIFMLINLYYCIIICSLFRFYVKEM